MPSAPVGLRSSPAALVASLAVIMCAWSPSAWAQHATLESPAPINPSLAVLLSSPPFFHSVPPRVGVVGPLGGDRIEPHRPSRPAALPALYVSFAVLQGLDAHSTLSAVGAGRTEANPALRGLVTQPAAFIGAKLAATAATLYMSERLWRKHRGAAVALMVAANVAYGAIVAHNYRSTARDR